MMSKRFFHLGRGLTRYILGLIPDLGIVLSAYAFLLLETAAKGGNFSNELSHVLLQPVAILALVQSCYFIFQTILWLHYKPWHMDPLKELPRVSVIIPAYNEGPMVGRSIRSVVAADYPLDKLEIIVVDDGSRDDTYFHMAHLRAEFPELVKLIRFGGNQGKRAALNAGFRAATGEIVVTIDSDSEIDAMTLRAMVAPFQQDPQVGAVAGRVTVLNRSTFIGKMLDVQFAISFDFVRAGQSHFRAVAVCPGALSAFRRALILPFLDQWLDQRFLGRPVTHGEDQALTNIVLRNGYDTVYQRGAVVRTLAPHRYRQLCKMFTRWDRSYIVEGFSFAKFMFSRYRTKNRVLPAVNFMFEASRLAFTYVAIAHLPFVLSRPDAVWRYIFAFLLAATSSALFYVYSERSFRFVYGVVYAVYAFLLLQWIFPWALITVRDERWGTR